MSNEFPSSEETKMLDGHNIDTAINDITKLFVMIEKGAPYDPYINAMKKYVCNPLAYLIVERIVKSNEKDSHPINIKQIRDICCLCKYCDESIDVWPCKDCIHCGTEHFTKRT